MVDLLRRQVCCEFDDAVLSFKLTNYTIGTKKTTPVKPKVKDGRGRPRKSLPANGEKSSPSDAKPKTKEEPTEKLTEESAEEPIPDVPEDDSGRSYWLMKAEPESRIENGVDVKFSIDDLAAATLPEPWDGKFLNLLYSSEHRLIFDRRSKHRW